MLEIKSHLELVISENSGFFIVICENKLFSHITSPRWQEENNSLGTNSSVLLK